MYSVLRKFLSIALIALMMTGMVFQAAAEETRTPSGEASETVVAAVETPAEKTDAAASEPSSVSGGDKMIKNGAEKMS